MRLLGLRVAVVFLLLAGCGADKTALFGGADARVGTDARVPPGDGGVPLDAELPPEDAEVPPMDGALPPSDAGRDALVIEAGPSGPCESLPEVPSFPGAEGFGAVARGGRCGRVIHVTNLDTSGPGSFADAMHQSGPRYIVFDVSGVINDYVGIERGGTGRVTIAGQTSPGGITIRGLKFNEEALQDGGDLDDIIVRFIRSRPDGAGLDDAFRFTYSHRVIVDHCSFARADDEATQISYSRDISYQNNILGETISEHFMYGGMLINYSDPPGDTMDNLSIHHNLFTRLEGRLPEISRENHPSAVGTFMNIELSSNLLWDPGIGIWIKDSTEIPTDGPVYYHLNWVDNYMYARPSYQGFMMLSEILSSDMSTLYVSGNRFNNAPSWSDYQLVYCCNDLVSSGPNTDRPRGTVRTERHPFPAITYTPALELLDYMVANVGPFPRDAMDQRFIDAVATRTIESTPRSTGPDDALENPWGAGPPPPPPVDTDQDGMPDDWELAHGLDPSVQDHNGTGLSAVVVGREGYTNLEVYLNELADQRVRDRR